LKERWAKVRATWPVVRRVWITLGLIFLVVFTTWSVLAYRASPEAVAALTADSAVRVERDSGVWQFIPNRSEPSTRVGFVFFPGALVNPAAYAPLARATAMRGHPSFIVTLPRRGAFGGAEDPLVRLRMNRVLQRYTLCWVLGGHSRGGVVTSQFASERPNDWFGLVFIGTSHPRDVDLSAMTIPVTKIVGTRDGLASRPEVEANRSKLPSSTRWVWIDGGNHSQFGWYGFQPGDKRASIPAEEQRTQMIAAVLETLGIVESEPKCRALPTR
jgi:pimeloyl-ACP methyl ester carboxylesterase